MKTKDQIKQSALKLFNVKGVMNVTLRDVAGDLEKSYGNITYHFSKKEVLIESIYQDMIAELQLINQNIVDDKCNLLAKVIKAPLMTFDLTMKYIFFYMDFIEIRRNFSELYNTIDENNKRRMQVWKYSLIELQNQNFIQSDMDEADLFYLMELSGAVRTYFFLKLTKEDLKNKDLKSEYVTYTNKLFYPYLTAEGKKEYKKVIATI